jgi:hypothetical protein
MGVFICTRILFVSCSISLRQAALVEEPIPPHKSREQNVQWQIKYQCIPNHGDHITPEKDPSRQTTKMARLADPHQANKCRVGHQISTTAYVPSPGLLIMVWILSLLDRRDLGGIPKLRRISGTLVPVDTIVAKASCCQTWPKGIEAMVMDRGMSWCQHTEFSPWAVGGSRGWKKWVWEPILISKFLGATGGCYISLPIYFWFEPFRESAKALFAPF